jgi:thioesterase domain-containing protein/acyl carrier protein
VKVRGFRIEPGEVSAALAALPGAGQVAVLARVLAGETRLVAYYTGTAQADDLRATLQCGLPDYMVPAHFVTLASLPLSANGKIDLKALPLPRLDGSTQACQAPRTALEAALAPVWAEVLHLEHIGIDDDFFRLGGHSLLLMVLANRIEQALGIRVPVAQLFATPTIAGLAAALDTQGGGSLLVPLRDGGPAAPLYVVHAGGGQVHCYADLARALAPGRAVVGIQSALAAGMETGMDNLRDACTAYCDALAEHQPDGPIHLAGWSIGGMLALALAAELEARGRQVGAVLLFDAIPPATGASPMDTLTGYVELVLGYGEDDFASIFGRGLLPLRQRLRALAEELSTARLAAMLEAGSTELATVHGFERGWQAVFVDGYRNLRRHAELVRGFTTPALRAPVHSFWAQAGIDGGNEPLCWQGASTATGCTCEVLPGTHASFIQGPGAGALARRVDMLLAQTGPIHTTSETDQCAS